MEIEVKVPQLPDGVTGAKIVSFHVNKGQEVALDQALFDVETDKVVLEVIAPTHGIIESIQPALGDDVDSQQVIMQMRETTPPAAPSETVPAASETVYVENVVEKRVKGDADQLALEPVVGNSLFDKRGIVCGLIGLAVGVFIGAIGAVVVKG